MEKQQCLNLCEVLQHIAGDGDIYEKMNQVMRMGELTKCERIYFGSYFCGQYFVHLPKSQVEKLLDFCKQHQIKLTLVVPILTQKHLNKGKEKIEELLRLFGKLLDEITINDYGMLSYLNEKYNLDKGGRERQHFKLNIGRLLLKDYRDPRYTEYFNLSLKPRSFTNYMQEVIKNYKIHCLEFDPTHAVIDFSECPEGVLIGLHTPYCYETVGQICQMAGIHQPIDKKFRPNEVCQKECEKEQIHYFSEGGYTWIKHGRTVYFKNLECQVRGIEQIRSIYSPLEWEEEK